MLRPQAIVVPCAKLAKRGSLGGGSGHGLGVSPIHVSRDRGDVTAELIWGLEMNGMMEAFEVLDDELSDTATVERWAVGMSRRSGSAEAVGFFWVC